MSRRSARSGTGSHAIPSGGTDDGFEILSYRRDFAEWLADNPEEAKRVEGRRRLVAQTYQAQTLSEVARAREALSWWRREHPGDDRLDTEALYLDMFQEVLKDEERTAAREPLQTPAHV